MRFEGQTVIVSGASEGIGFATAQGLAREGAHVAMFARRPDVLAAAAAAVREEGGSAETVAVDVTDTDNFIRAIEGVGERRGRLDGLVNNAFKSIQAPLVETSLADWRAVFEATVESAFIGIRTALPIMAQARRGAIVNISSVSGVRARSGASAYGAAKAALVHLGAVAAVEAAEYGVRVNTVTPGLTKTASYRRVVAELGEALLSQVGPQNIPLGRAAEPEDVAKAVLFLLSDDAGFITGVDLRAEGGAYWKR